MDEQPPNYRKSFLTSPHHIVLGLATLGLGFMSTELLPLIAGATAYALGWIYLPDLRFFRRWVDNRHDADKRAAALAQVEAFVQRRDALLSTLNSSRRRRYEGLA